MKINSISDYSMPDWNIKRTRTNTIQKNASFIDKKLSFAPKNLNIYSFIPVSNISFKGSEKSKPYSEPSLLSMADDEHELKYDMGDCLYPYVPYEPSDAKFDAKKFLDDIRYENAEKKYVLINTKSFGAIASMEENHEARNKLTELDNLSPQEKREFIKVFCEETGFPDLSKVKQKQEAEIKNALHSLSEKYNFDVKFIGYDKNCSMGRGISIPGSDCDALYMIIDDTKIKDGECAPSVRWKFKDVVNQRVLCTHASGVPDLLSVNYINDGLDLADSAYKKADFKMSDLFRFKMNMFDNSKDFVGAGEFDIRLAEELPDDMQTRDKFYKTAMFVELVRDGVILENSFSPELMTKIKKSPLYKYSNIIRQKGLENKSKNKHEKRKSTIANFKNMGTDEQFDLIRDIIRSSFDIKDAKNRALFVNENPDGKDEMGNILVLYDKLMHSKKQETVSEDSSDTNNQIEDNPSEEDSFEEDTPDEFDDFEDD